MSVTIQDNFSTAAAKPTDARYGPYNSDVAAATAIPETYRYKGLTVGVLNSGVVEEYWWNNVLTGNPIKKASVGNVTSISQGTGISVSTTSPDSAQTPKVSIDSTVVQTISNLSTNVSVDGTSDVYYPSVKAVKDYADGLVVGLLNDRGNWAAGSSPGPYPSNPPATGSGPSGDILKGDIWFINVAGYLGTTYVSIGASVRALVDNPSPSTDADWDIIDAGLGFTPENSANKVDTGANVDADLTSTSKYPSVNAMVQYVQTYSPAPTTPNLQAVTGVGASTTNSIAAQAFGFYDSSTLSYAALSCDTTGSPSRILIEDSYASPRLSLDTAGTDLTVWANTGSTQAILDFASVSGTQTYTFPNATGTIALQEWVTGQNYVISSGGTDKYIPKFSSTGSQIINSSIYDDSGNIGIGTTSPTTKLEIGVAPFNYSDGLKVSSSIYETIITDWVIAIKNKTNNYYPIYISNYNFGVGSYSPGDVNDTLYNNTYIQKRFNLNKNISLNFIEPASNGIYNINLPNATGTLVATVATSAGNLSTGTDGKVTIPDANATTTGLVNTTTQTFSGDKTIKGSVSTTASAALNVTNSSNTSLLFARNDGNVGIGTSSPAYTLDLSGSANFYLSGNTVPNPFSNKFSIRNGMLRLGTSSVSDNNQMRFIQFTDQADTIEYFAFGATSGNSGNNPIIAMGNKDALYIYSGPANSDIYNPPLTLGNNVAFTIKKDGRVRYTPLASAPSSPEEGDTYYDSSDNKLKVYTGSAWEDCN